MGAALRGCQVYVIAPSRDNAPKKGFIPVARTREVFSRFVEIQRQLAPEIQAAGGRLQTGLYARRTESHERDGRLREVVEGYRRHPFLAEDFPLAASFVGGLLGGPRPPNAPLDEQLPLQDAREREPQLHRKTQFLATRETLRALAERVMARRGPGEPLLRAAGDVPLAAEDPAGLGVEGAWLEDELRQAHRGLPDEIKARSVYYLTVGSLNKDTRSKVLDGEVLYVLSGEASLVAYTDFAVLVGSTTWIESQEELDRLLPPSAG